MIDWNACNSEFFENNLQKIDILDYEDYNEWIGVVWRLKSLDISLHKVKEWCAGSLKFDSKKVEDVYKNNKPKDPFEKTAKWFAKAAKIQLPNTIEERKSDIKESLIINTNFENFIKTTSKLPKQDFDVRDTSLLKYFFKSNDWIYIVRNQFDSCEEAYDALTLIEAEKPLKNYSLFSIASYLNGDGKRNQANLKEMRYVLLECDYLSLERQLQFFYSLIEFGFPVKSIIYSGGKSFHCLIKIHPMKDVVEYKAYCEKIYNLINKLVFKAEKSIKTLVDTANKDGIRYSRSPFGFRQDKEKTQEMIYCDMIEADQEQYNFEDVLQQFERYVGNFIKNENDTADKILDHFIGEKCDLDYAVDKAKCDIEDIFLNNASVYIKLKNKELQKISRQDLFDYCLPYIKDVVTQTILPMKNAKSQYLELKDFFIPIKDIKFEVRLDKNENIHNLYKPGFITECLKKKVSEMPSEFEKLLNNLADEKEKNWLINHMSCHLQLILNNFKMNEQDFVLETVPVFYGKSGTGKNTLLDVIGQAISSEGTRYISIGNIADDFNEFYLAGAVNVNEAANGRSERRASKEALKRFTDKYQRINIKFMQKINILNTAYKTISANESIFGVLDIDQFDRRYQYICGGTQLNGQEHNLLDMALFEKQKKDFISFLLNYECDYKKAMSVFDNNPKIEDKYNSLSNLEKISMTIEENIDFFPYDNFTMKMFLVWYEDNFEKISYDSRTIGKILKTHFYHKQAGKDIFLSNYGTIAKRGQRYYSKNK